MWEEKIFDKIKEKISLNNYKSANFQFAIQNESGLWKIIIVRIVFDIREPKENKTLIDFGDFRLENVSIPINQFLTEFLPMLERSNSNQLSVINSIPQVPNELFFELGAHKLCFIGNFSSDTLYFMSREQAIQDGIDNPTFQISYSLHPSTISKSYRQLDLITHEIPFRNVTEAINDSWKTHYDTSYITNNNFHMYFPIYDASIISCKIKGKHAKLTLNINHEKIRPEELSVGVIADGDGEKIRERKNVTTNILEFDLTIIPNTIHFSLSRGKELLDEFNWKSSNEKSNLKEILSTGFFGNPSDTTSVANLSKVKNADNDALDLPILREDFPDGIRVFISHKFIKNDQELALGLQNLLLDNSINGYLAERKREYEKSIDEKIKNKINESDYLVAIITKDGLFSPSVHQEIGYAMGVKIPVLVMVEGDLEIGVLIKPKEKEFFDRTNFNERCENILTHILDNGKRKRLSPDEKREMIENVYRPCYNQMMNEYKKRAFIDYIPSNKWKDLESFWQFRTEPEMKELFENYTHELEKWHRMWVDFANNFQTHQHVLGEIIKPAFLKVGLLKNDRIALPKDSAMDLKDWLHAFMFVIFDNNVRGEEELYNALLDFAIKTRNGHQLWLEEWKQNKSELFFYLSDRIPNLIETLKTPVPIENLNQQRVVLKTHIEKLTLALEEKLK